MKQLSDFKITDSFLTTSFNQLIQKNLVQNYILKTKNISIQKIKTFISSVLFDHTFSVQNYLKMYKFCRYVSRKEWTRYGSFLHNLEIGQKFKKN